METKKSLRPIEVIKELFGESEALSYSYFDAESRIGYQTYLRASLAYSKKKHLTMSPTKWIYRKKEEQIGLSEKEIMQLGFSKKEIDSAMRKFKGLLVKKISRQEAKEWIYLLGLFEYKRR